AEHGRLAAILGLLRERVRRAIPDARHRTTFWRRLAVRENLDAVRRGDDDVVRTRALALLHNARPRGRAPGTVYIVGAGPGATDLITVRALECLQRADVIVY